MDSVIQDDQFDGAAPEWGWGAWLERAVLSDEMHSFHCDGQTAFLEQLKGDPLCLGSDLIGIEGH